MHYVSLRSFHSLLFFFSPYFSRCFFIFISFNSSLSRSFRYFFAFFSVVLLSLLFIPFLFTRRYLFVFFLKPSSLLSKIQQLSSSSSLSLYRRSLLVYCPFIASFVFCVVFFLQLLHFSLAQVCDSHTNCILLFPHSTFIIRLCITIGSSCTFIHFSPLIFSTNPFSNTHTKLLYEFIYSDCERNGKKQKQ